MKDKKADKIKKHFKIKIDENDFKIMNYIITEEPDQTLRLITKIRGQKFPKTSIVKIKIPTMGENITLCGTYKAMFSSPMLEDWIYEIE